MTILYSPHINLNEALLSTQVMSLFIDELESKGVSSWKVLEGTGLHFSDLGGGNAYIRYTQVLQIVENALRLYPGSGLGLKVGQKERVSSWGLLGFAIMSSPNLMSALKFTNQYYLVGPALSDFEFHLEPDRCVLQMYTSNPVENLLPTLVEELFACVYTVFPVLLGTSFNVREIELSYDKPSYSDQYDKLFRCPISYNNPYNRLIFEPDYLSLPLVTADSVSADLSRSLCQEALQRSKQPSDLTHSVFRILKRTPGRFPSMELVAEELGISSRTLRRNLSISGTNFQELLDTTRANLSIDYLKTSSISLEEVAARAGFSEYNNFRKAFRRWTGKPPSYYRD